MASRNGITKVERPRKGVVYVARWYDPNGRQKAKTFSKEAEARSHLRTMMGSKVTGDYVDPNKSKVLFSTVAEEWLSSGPGRKQSTRDGYEYILRRHVLPYFGDVQVGKIRRQALREFIAALSSSGSAPGTIRNIFRNVLKPSLDLAVENEYLRTNPASGIELPSSEHEQMLFLDAAEVNALAEAITVPYGVLTLFATYTGLRAGEVAALRVKHLNLIRGFVRVEQSSSIVKGKGTVYGPTKTYAKRNVPIPVFLHDPLAAYIAPRAKDPEAFVFVSKQGLPLNHKNFYGRHFKPAVRRALPDRLAGLRFHDLRHTCAALMINLPGAEPLLICKRLGHSSIQVTYDRYGHLFPERSEEITSGLEATYYKAANASGTVHQIREDVNS